MEANANRQLSADQISKANEWNKLQGIQDVYGTKLEVENAILSQQLTDAWGKFQGQQAASSSLMSGIAGANQILSQPTGGGGGGSSSSGWGSIISGIGGLVSSFF